MANVLTKIFGSRNDRLLKQYSRTVAEINAFEPAVAKLSDSQLRGKTDALKQQHAAGASLEQLLPEAFAVVREAARRTLRMRHFDVQLQGGMLLPFGKIAEMKTGEGKPLVATLPAYLNALTGKGVHIVTVNDYLARRDAEWMGKIYGFLGLTVGVNVPQMEAEEKRKAYAADITYGTNNEFGFDYLRDNMAMRVEERYQRGLHYAIVDEVDSILSHAAEAKKNVATKTETQTLASITSKNYSRMYGKRAGMTGTADTEAYEFQQIYGLETVVVPTHMKMVRIDREDQVYRTLKEKYQAVIKDIRDCSKRDQPVLVGTTSIENSELISGMLTKEKLPHQVLNAKQHAREAEIVAQAGSPGVITIATNMAGRGTDIVLGGNVEKQCDFVEADSRLGISEKQNQVVKLRGEWQQLHERVVKAGR